VERINKPRIIKRWIVEEDKVDFHNSNMIRTCYISTVRMIIFEMRFMVLSDKI